MTILPFNPDADNQEISFPFDGETYTLTFRYNYRDAGWYVSIVDSDNTPIVSGKRIAGRAQLIPLNRLPTAPPGLFAVVDINQQGTAPGRRALGVDNVLIYVAQSELGILG